MKTSQYHNLKERPSREGGGKPGGEGEDWEARASNFLFQEALLDATAWLVPSAGRGL